MTVLERPSMSLYQQLLSILEEEIKDGKFSNSSRLPSEEELCNIYKVSRTTVRKSLAHLVNRGIICRYKKKGTFILDRKIESSVPLLKDRTREESLSISFLLCNARYIDPYYSQQLAGVEHKASKHHPVSPSY